MRKHLVTLGTALWCGLLFSTALAQTPTSLPSPSPEPPELIIDQIKKSVVFIQGDFSRQQVQMINGTPQPIQIPQSISGTGFLIILEDKRVGENGGFYFLVTNKHLIREPGPNGTLGEGPYFKDVLVRMNTKTPASDGSQFGLLQATVVDDYGTLQWFTDPDESVDLAITPIAIGDILDIKTIGSSIFATKEVIKRDHINEMDELLFAGLFARNPGAKKNYPIVRHGKIARLSVERIPVDPLHPSKTVEVHLADVMSFGGNSGSPVFLRVGGVREGGPLLSGYRYYLLGVMQGFFPETIDIAVNLALTKGVAAENSGIAAVIPADKILEVLNTPRAQAYQERALAQLQANAGKLEQAEESCQKAIAMLERSAPETSDLATALEAYAIFLRTKKHDKESEKEATRLEGRAKSLRSTSFPVDRMHPHM